MQEVNIQRTIFQEPFDTLAATHAYRRESTNRMDLRLFLDVIARFKWLFTLGVLTAIVGAFFSTASVRVRENRPVVSWRAAEQWSSYSRVLITAPTIKYGSIGGSNTTTSGGDVEGRSAYLATLYASFATSDRVKEIIRGGGTPVSEKFSIEAAAIPTTTGATLPIVQLAITSETAASSRLLVDRAARALKSYVEQQQVATNVPTSSRVQLVVLNKGGNTKLVAPRSKALPVIAFLTICFATIAFLFALNNLMPAVRRPDEARGPDDASLRIAERGSDDPVQHLEPQIGDVAR